MSRYAKSTTVSPERSRTEIERTLVRYGATGFMYAWSETANAAVVQFSFDNWRVRFLLPMPEQSDFVADSRGRKRPPSHQKKALEQNIRQRWRALALAVKAKLETVESGIAAFEEEFMPYLVLPGKKGQTAGEYLLPQIVESYQTGKLPPLLESPNG